jgi:hypothetical protein
MYNKLERTVFSVYIARCVCVCACVSGRPKGAGAEADATRGPEIGRGRAATGLRLALAGERHAGEAMSGVSS